MRLHGIRIPEDRIGELRRRYGPRGGRLPHAPEGVRLFGGRHPPGGGRKPRYARFIVIRKTALASVFSSRLRSNSTDSTGFMSLSTRRSR